LILKKVLKRKKQRKNHHLHSDFRSASAEREGFEPPVPLGTLVFKTSAFNRSAISPGTKLAILWLLTSTFLKKIVFFLLQTDFQAF
jgi:hypothetical protein